jgi:transmembrane sensor
MSSEMDPIVEAAIAWHVRLAEGDGDAWAEFAGWLAADPRHAAAYDRVEALGDRVDALLPEVAARGARSAAPAALSDLTPAAAPASMLSSMAAYSSRRRRYFAWAGGAIAASLLAALLWLPGSGTQRYEIVTALGETRLVQLEPGTEVAINGGTRIILDRKDPRFVSLAEGQALFRVEHDAARPFVVEMGLARVVDFGTVFDIRRDPKEIRVAVSEGKVEYQTGGNRVALSPGDQLSASGDREPVVSATAREAVGAWERGELLYSGAPLSLVAADLSRTLGLPIAASPAIASRPFSGNLTMKGANEAEIRRLGIAIDVTFRRTGEGWTMEPARSAGE